MEEKIASLIASLDHPSKAVTREAADALLFIAVDRPELVERLNRLLNDGSQQNRWPVAYILARLPNPSPLCVNVLLDTLGSEDRDNRWAAASLLVRLSKDQPETVPSLAALADHGTSTQKRMALYCLRDIDPRGPTTLKALVQSLGDPDPLVRIAATTSLAGQAKVSQEEIETLLRLFREDADSRVRCSAAFTLAQLGGPTTQIVAALTAASQSDDPQLKKAADAALELLQKKGPIPSVK